MLHVPALRYGKAYESLDSVEILHHRTRAPVAKVSQVSAGLIQRDARQAGTARRKIQETSCERLLEICDKAADLFVCPSRHEPLGNVIIEAWSHGLPVVAARAAGPEELIEADDSGVLVPLEDAGALAAGIRTVLSDHALRDALTVQGRRSFETSYTEATIVERYRTLFEALAETPAG